MNKQYNLSVTLSGLEKAMLLKGVIELRNAKRETYVNEDNYSKLELIFKDIAACDSLKKKLLHSDSWKEQPQ